MPEDIWKLTWAESAWTEGWMVTGAEALDLDAMSDSFAEWLLDAEASRIDEPFFTRFEPAVVETFHASCTPQCKSSISLGSTTK